MLQETTIDLFSQGECGSAAPQNPRPRAPRLHICVGSAAERVAKFAPNPLLMGRNPSDFVYESLKKIKTSDIEQALILLPFNDAIKVLEFCEGWLSDPMETEFVCKIVMTLVRIHLDQLQVTNRCKPLLTKLKGLVRPCLEKISRMIGTNAAAIAFLNSSSSGGGAGGFSE